MSDALIPPRSLFRFSLPVRFRDPVWCGDPLDDTYHLVDLAQLDGRTAWADVRLAFSNDGLAFSVQIAGKHQPVWCRDSRLEDSDGVQIWIDTRATHTVHRATRYCHRFIFLPAGGGPRHRDPVADQLIIRRARENARPIRPRDLAVRGHVVQGGYTLEGHIPASAMTGFDPEQHPRLGFTYAIYDRELGLQTLSTGSGLPYEEDPSTWATLDLVR